MADAVGNPEANKMFLICMNLGGDVAGLARILREGKAHIDCQDPSGDTGLMLSCSIGNVECLKLLLAANASINTQNLNGETGLMQAVRNDHADCLKLLLAAHADANVQDEMGYTGLILASMHGHMDCLTILLQINANVNLRNRRNDTALRIAGFVRPETKPLMHFLLLSCGAEEEGKESLTEMNTRITEYHTELMDVLSEGVVVDTRFHLKANGLYHEPLERVMQYCGLELMLENDPNREETDPIPVLLRGRTRASSALYWWNLLH